MPINRAFQKSKKHKKDGFLVRHLYEMKERYKIWFMEYLVVVIVIGM